MCAVMIPPKISREDFSPESNELAVYESLKKLSSDYYVYHSLKASFLTDRNYNVEREADFVVFNPQKGLMVIEVKNTPGFKVENGVWYYHNGKVMHHGKGPYEQARTYADRLKSFLRKGDYKIAEVLPIVHMVWFIGIENSQLNKNTSLCDTQLFHTFGKNDLRKPEAKIERLFDIQGVATNNKRPLTNDEVKYLKQKLGIDFNVFDVSSYRSGRKEKFSRLLKEQVMILDFLDGQNQACIQGLGGTGKTVVAIRKAEKDSLDGKTLFLCYNKALYEHLYEKYKDLNIDFYNIDKFVKVVSKYDGIDGNQCTYETARDYILSDKFDYKHVVIDEGQDFGKTSVNIINNHSLSDLFDAFRIKTESLNGSFYVFYDKFQCIQSNEKNLPDFIKNPDCLLTLHKNCRNTNEIRYTSTKPLFNKIKYKVKTIPKGISGEQPVLRIVKCTEDVGSVLNKIIESLRDKGENDIEILTFKTLSSTSLSKSKKYREYENNGKYSHDNHTYEVSTIRKFKGLESDCIILIDATEKNFSESYDEDFENGILMFYVGASRAINSLHILAAFDTNELKNILENEYQFTDIRNPVRQLCGLLSVKYEK